MGRMLYLDCSSGISGDMVVGALVDCGVDVGALRHALGSLGVDGFDLRVSRRNVAGLAACDFDVVLDEAHDGHDHDMAYLYGDRDGEGGHRAHHHGHGRHEDRHGEEGHEDHRHGHHHGHGHHHHEHRRLADVLSIIDAGELSPRARSTARRIFEVVAEAEAAAHGTTVGEVHFHEVGAVDSIIDVVAAAFCLDALDVGEVAVSPLAEGHGRVRCAHGVLAVPVPAVVNIVAAHGLVLERRDVFGELVTPTGAAIAAAVRTADTLPARYRVLASGVGSGKRAYDPPSTVRALVIEPVDDAADTAGAADGLGTPELWKLECEVDDCTGEALGAALEHLYAAGAREAHFLPVFMKKGRPGYQVEALCDESAIGALERVLFEDTTTIGVRRTPQWRHALARTVTTVVTEMGEAQVKTVTLPDGSARTYPEHDSVATLAASGRVSYQDALRTVLAAIRAARL